MHIKSWQYLILIGGMSGIILFYFFCPIYQISNNETMLSSPFGWKFYDGSIFIALIASITTILVTYYTVNKNYKSMKLTALPDNSANLLIDLEFAFNKYELYKSHGKGDELILLTEILKYWKAHQKAFKLLTPKFYKNFSKTINRYMIKPDEENTKDIQKTHLKEENSIKQNQTSNKSPRKEIESKELINKDKCSHTNCDYILKALIAQITNIAFENDESYFEFIKPELITDETNIKKIGNDAGSYTKIKINEKELNTYIENIKGKTTKVLTHIEFEKLTKDLKNMLKDLKKEIEEY